MMNIETTLRDVFGFSEFREGQKAAIHSLIAGNSTLAVFPTGAGKSLCYQLPALHFDGMTLVVSPLIALMKDQIDFLVSRDVPAARLDSSLSGDEARAVWDGLRCQRLKLLYVAPERFNSERFLQRLNRTSISLMVVDEAHCISEWGHNFRPDYLKLAKISQDIGVERVLALTATATPQVADDIREGFGIPAEAYVNTGFHRPNLTLRATPCSAQERDERLRSKLRERPPGASIVYVTQQRTAEGVAALLKGDGLDARHYHAGMGSEERHATQEWFMGTKNAIVVATIAFGMGIDRPDIRYVYHYNMPKSLENYQQETGRAGRDGLPAECEAFICPDDTATLENFVYGDTPTEEGVRSLVADILGMTDTFDVSKYELATRYDIRDLVVSTLLTYLELEGVIEATGPFYDTYRFQPLRSSRDILSHFNQDRQAFLRQIFSQAKPGRKWFTLEVNPAAQRMGEPRERIVAALNYLEEQGHMAIQVAGVRLGYRILQRPGDGEELASRLAVRFEESEARDIERVRQVLALAELRACLVGHVLEYFGEALDGDCGHCDRCLGEAEGTLPPAVEYEFTSADAKLLADLRAEGHKALSTPRQVTRFLCGLSSPGTSRGRPPLTRHERFGALAHVPFRQALDFVEKRV